MTATQGASSLPARGPGVQRLVARIAYVVVALPLTVLVVMSAVGAAQYLMSVSALSPTAQANVAGPLDPWTSMDVCILVAAVVSLFGVWLSFARRAWFTGVLFMPLALIPTVMMESNRMDVIGPSDLPGVQVVDGSHLIFDHTKLRLAGIVAPDAPPKAHCWAEAALGIEARQLIQELTLGPYVRRWRIVVSGAADPDGFKPGRLIADDGDDLAEELVGRRGAVRRADGKWDWCAASHASDLDPPLSGPGPTLIHGGM